MARIRETARTETLRDAEGRNRPAQTISVGREIGPDDPTPNYHSAYAAGRALTLIDKLHRDRENPLDDARYHAGKDLRRLWLHRTGRSEGVGSYGDSGKATDLPKVDRVGLRLTGLRIRPDGTIDRNHGRRRSRANERHLEDAIFAAFGLHDQEGNKIQASEMEIALLIGAVDATDPPLTLTGITLALTRRYGAKSKQAPPYGMGFLDLTLGRLAHHFGYLRR